MSGELLRIRALDVVVDVDGAAAALRRAEQSELLRSVEQAVAVLIEELVTQARTADRVLEIGERVGRVEVVAAAKALEDRAVVTGEVVGEAETRRHAVGRRHGARRDRDRRHGRHVAGALGRVDGRIPVGQHRVPARRERLLREAVHVVLVAQAGIDRHAVGDLPRIAQVRRVVDHVVLRRVRRVVQLELAHRVVLVAVEDVARLRAAEQAAIALPVVAELEVVTALPAVLEVVHRHVDLRLVPLLILIGVVVAGALVVRRVDAAGNDVAGEAILIGRIQREEVVPVTADDVEEEAVAEHAGPFELPRVVARRLVAGRRDRHQRTEVAQFLQLVALVQEANHLIRAIELEGALEGVVVGQLRARQRVDAEGVLVLVVQAVAVEEPRLLLPKRTADVEVDIVLAVDRVAAGEGRAGEVAVLVLLVGSAEGVWHVVADRRVALPVAVPVAREAIAAGLDGDAHVGAAAEAVGARAGAAELKLFEAAEVEVAGVGAGAFGGVDAFELGLVLIAETVGEEPGLGAGA